MNHNFDIEIAKTYGIEEAILLENFNYWISKNKANNENFIDGKYWTYNSAKAFTELFPYMSVRKIQYAINNLIKQGLLIKGNHNKKTYDRTLWYAITDKGFAILQNCQMEMTKLSNGNDKIVKPIPNNKQQILNTNIYIKDIEYIVGFLNEKADVHYKPTTKETQQKIIKLLKQGFDKRDFEQVITTMVTEWKGTDMEKYLRPETLFGNKFESYLNRNVKKTVGKSGYTREELDEIDRRCGVYV